jgi:magnesium transporter
MLTRYTITGKQLTPTPDGCDAESIHWADLQNPTREEEQEIEECFGIEIPTQEEMAEIEISSRLYQDRDSYVLTTPLIVKADSALPQTDAITFILSPRGLVTLRYSSPQSFINFINRAERGSISVSNSTQIFLGLLDAITDRLADILEMTGRRIDETSASIFRTEVEPRHSPDRPDLKRSLREVAHSGDMISKARESLVGLSRLVSYISSSSLVQSHGERDGPTISSLQNDLSSLTDHANFLSSKVNFLLDATLGMINIEQNGIIKIFSVAAVVFLPPTLVASIYGMNFHHMPELDWRLGYPMALGLMLLSAYLPFRWFKAKKWL